MKEEFKLYPLYHLARKTEPFKMKKLNKEERYKQASEKIVNTKQYESLEFQGNGLVIVDDLITSSATMIHTAWIAKEWYGFDRVMTIALGH